MCDVWRRWCHHPGVVDVTPYAIFEPFEVCDLPMLWEEGHKMIERIGSVANVQQAIDLDVKLIQADSTPSECYNGFDQRI